MVSILEKFRVSMNPDATAFLMPDGAISFRQVNGVVERIEDRLAECGLVGGRRVAVAMPRSPLGLALFLAISQRNVCCPVSPSQRLEEFRQFLDASGAETLIAEPNAGTAIAAAEQMGIPRLTVSWTAPEQLDFGVAGQCSSSRHQERGFALMMQTSGTTSNPKRVFLTHSQLMTTTEGIIEAFSLSPSDVCLNPMPFQHLHGLVTAGLSTLLGGGSMVCLDSFSPVEFMTAYERFSPTWLTGSPAMHIALLDHFVRHPDSVPVRGLRFLRSSSAPLPAAIIDDLEQIFQAPLIETYGLTETASMITTNPLPPGNRKTGSVGVACSGAEIAILVDSVEKIDTGVGEVLVRGPSVILHYGEQPHMDAENFYGDWLRTGDLGYIDADGYLFITGRAKELIKRGGISVHPGEIDNALMAMPEVSDAASFSVPHPSLGEDVVSLVVVAPGTDADALRARLFEHMSSYKIPSAVIPIDSIPKSETGKIVRRTLSVQMAGLLATAGLPADDPFEARLLDAWRAELGRDDIGITDNLFLHGADPMKASEFQKKHPQFTPPSIRNFWFAHPTVRSQIQKLRALDQLDQMDEVL